MKTNLTFALICLFAASLLAGSLQLHSALAQPITTVYIRPSGNVDPASAPIQRSGDLYTLTGNIINTTLVIQKSSMTLDGAGFSLQASDPALRTYRAISLTGVSNVTLKNVAVQFLKYGIEVVGSHNVTIEECSITLSYPNDPTNPTGEAVSISTSTGILVSKNIVTSTLNTTLAPVFGLTISGSSLNISENRISGFNVGINDAGESSENNTISWNNVSGCPTGIRVESNDEVFANDVFGAANQGRGIILLGSTSSVFGNTITGSGDGLTVRNPNNFIYGNNFLENTRQAFIDIQNGGGSNLWDNGAVGNYWSDYASKYPNATEADASGTWNTPYVLDANNTDHHPLLNPISAEQAIELMPPQPTPSVTPSTSRSPSPPPPQPQQPFPL